MAAAGAGAVDGPRSDDRVLAGSPPPLASASRGDGARHSDLMQDADTIQKFAFDGPLSIGQLVAVGLVVALISGVLTWRDCKTSASLKLFALLFLSRLIAL